MGATTLLSFEEFEQLPSEPGKTELLDGELIQLPPSKRRHVKLAHRTRDRLAPLLKKDGAALVGEVDLGMGYKFGARSWLRPDVSVEHVDQAGDDYFENSPVLAIAIVSEFDLADQMDRKIKTYLSNGGHEVWVVYPKTKCIWVFREGHAQEFRGSLRSEIAGGLEIDIHDLFD